ncbi:ATP-binding cassette domain-containing protein, partial [Chloroflexota bacterium]
LEKVGLAGRGKDRVETYSKGLKQRLMIARSMVNRPRVLFLDEPTAGLDPASSEVIRNIVREESDRGATVFLTTHDMHDADELSDFVAFMNQGKIVALDTPLNLKRKYGKRALRAKVSTKSGELEDREITLDTPETPGAIQKLFADEEVVTVHSEEATLEDIFISITGRGLVE